MIGSQNQIHLVKTALIPSNMPSWFVILSKMIVKRFRETFFKILNITKLDHEFEIKKSCILIFLLSTFNRVISHEKVCCLAAEKIF